MEIADDRMQFVENLRIIWKRLIPGSVSELRPPLVGSTIPISGGKQRKVLYYAAE